MSSHTRNPSASHAHFGASTAAGASSGAGGGREKTYFERQREDLIMDIATSFEHVLANINKLNRGLEATIAVGNEFSSVEALWSQFETFMAHKEEGRQQQQHGGQDEQQQQQQQQQQGRRRDGGGADEDVGEEEEGGGGVEGRGR